MVRVVESEIGRAACPYCVEAVARCGERRYETPTLCCLVETKHLKVRQSSMIIKGFDFCRAVVERVWGISSFMFVLVLSRAVLL